MKSLDKQPGSQSVRALIKQKPAGHLALITDISIVGLM